MKDATRGFVTVLVLTFAPIFAPIHAQQPLNPPLRNWAAPLFWAPTAVEAGQLSLEQRIAHPAISSAAMTANIFAPPGPLTFVAMTPCRVLDTRGEPYSSLTGAFGPPSLAPYTARSVPMPTSSSCSIPSNAGAYSLNITAISDAGGLLSSFSVWPAGAPYPNVSTLNDSVAGGVIANAAIVVAGTAGAIQMISAATTTTDVLIDINGYYAAPTDGLQNTAIGTGALSSSNGGNDNTAVGYQALTANTTGADNTAIGAGALAANITGSENTASGAGALAANITGYDNTASGAAALGSNTTGHDNTANGFGALGSNTTGSYNTANGQFALNTNSIGDFNTASGYQAMFANTYGANNNASGYQALYVNTSGSYNTASGNQALMANTSGSDNIAVGSGALGSNTTGSFNIGIGEGAASNVSGGNSNNIHIGSPGVSGDSSVLRIGSAQSSTYIAGIYGGVPSVLNLPVCVDANGTLGTTGCSTPSSRRFKEQITDMGDASSGLLQLRPVTFYYKPEYDDGSHTLQYGLIAEEVAEVYPDMVGYDKDGKPASVKYQSLAPMLLNEVRKQDVHIQDQAEAIRLQQEENQKLEDRLAALEALLSSIREPKN